MKTDLIINPDINVEPTPLSADSAKGGWKDIINRFTMETGYKPKFLPQRSRTQAHQGRFLCSLDDHDWFYKKVRLMDFESEEARESENGIYRILRFKQCQRCFERIIIRNDSTRLG